MERVENITELSMERVENIAGLSNEDTEVLFKDRVLEALKESGIPPFNADGLTLARTEKEISKCIALAEQSEHKKMLRNRDKEEESVRTKKDKGKRKEKNRRTSDKKNEGKRRTAKKFNKVNNKRDHKGKK
ncbi:hypothetical protein PAEPH01_1901 [Pancytospora epiphaga]|nr:hypothetical protein PAEPH01_1901 [Pancytospora epiphaga]